MVQRTNNGEKHSRTSSLAAAAVCLMTLFSQGSFADAQSLAQRPDWAHVSQAEGEDPPMAFQLYSSRNFPPLETQFRELRDLGYRQVEMNPNAISDPAAYKALLDTYGLSTPTGHFNRGPMNSDLAGCVALARLFGIEVLIISWLPPEDRPADAAGWASFARELEGIATALKQQGLFLGWHQHDFEFARLPDGQAPLDIILENAPSVLWQADIGWIARAGEDPLPWLERYRDRIVSAHIKDVAADRGQEGGWADVGYGTTDWERLLPVLRQARAVNWIVEHDNPSDYVRFARRAAETLAGWRVRKMQ